MATIDITGLPAAVVIDGSEKSVLVQGGTTKQFELSLVVNPNAQLALDSISTTQGAVLYRGLNDWLALTPGTSGYVLSTQGAAADPIWTPNTAGSVTSVAMSVPSFLSVAGSPITTTGTLAVTLATQTANTALIGPASGAVAAPTFRLLVNADLPNMAQNTFKGRISSGTGAVEDLTSANAKTILGIPTSSTDNAVVRFDGTTGNMQGGALIIADDGSVTGAGPAAAALNIYAFGNFT